RAALEAGSFSSFQTQFKQARARGV
ncbi:MAG: hypothetical protein RIQ69_2548, partial [Pseudomonadota bacterium]